MRSPSLLHVVTISLTVGLAPARLRAEARAPAATDDPVIVVRSRQHFRDGLAAHERGDYAAAYAEYLTAWKLRPHYAVASNLGTVELELRKYRDAAEHLAFALREAPKVGREAQRAKDELRLREAKEHVGAITVAVATPDASVELDGVPVGRAPLAGDLYVEPGPHTLQARLADRVSASVTAHVRAGIPASVTLVLPAGGPGSPAEPNQTAPNSAELSPTLAPAPAERADPRVLDPHAQSAADPRLSGIGPRSMTPLYLGSAAVLVAAATGVTFFVLSKQAGSDADAKNRELDTLAPDRNNSCNSPSPAIGSLCAELHDANQHQRTYRAAATVGFVLAGASALSGLALYFILPAPRRSPTLAPFLSHGAAGLAATGHF